jgi:hypothetical protein
MRILFPALTLLAACGPERALDDARAPDAWRGDADVQVFFAPDDDTLTLELAAIQRVTDAFAADPSPDPAAYGIRYAVYNLRNPEIIDALIDARATGVPVQILIDADQLDPERTWNTGDEALVDAGFSFADDHRDLSFEEATDIELLGIAGSGLMHLKTRLFETPAGTELLTGSQNPGDNALLNDETLHLVRDPAIVAAYDAAFESVLRDEDFHNTWDDGAALNVLFGPHASGDNAATKLFDWIAEEDEQILIAAYSVRDLTAPGYGASLVELLGQKVDQGVPVVLVTDRKQSDAWGDPTEDALRDVGVLVYEATNATTEFTAMHSKSVVLGRESIRVVTDTANLTAAGLGNAERKARNIESTLFFEPELANGRVGRRYLAQFMTVLDRYAWQSVDGDAPYAEVEAWLLSQPGWPVVPVTFGAEAHTVMGETVHATGDLDVLGQWGARGWGVPLHTDAGRYPDWLAEPVALPVGARLAWKLTAVGPDGVRWEAGDDRVDHVVPLSGESDAFLHATWR